MKTDPDYRFPLIRPIGEAVRPALLSRYWIVFVLIAVAILYLPFLSSGFFQDDYGFRLQFAPDLFKELGVDPSIMRNDPWNLYGFSWEASTRFALTRDKGFMPWWTSESIKTNFFRPLSSLSLALDFTLWPDAPALMHLHSLLWFLALIFLEYQLYRSISGSAVIAGISILLLAMDDVFAGPAGWICNRHTLIAMVFGLLALWLFHLGVSKKSGRFLFVANCAYALALLSSEMGLVTFAYLFAYMLVLDRDTWISRIKRILPFVLLTVAWRIGYTLMGYGATGSPLYLDPILNPADFLAQFLVRMPILLFSDIALPVVELILAFSPQAMLITAIVLALLLLPLIAIVYPILKKDRTSAFWAIGALCAIVPLVSGIPQNRNLGFVSLGVMALAGTLFVGLAKITRAELKHGLHAWLLRLTVAVLVFFYLVISPIVVLNNPASTKAMSDPQMAFANIGDSPEIANQHVYIINPPGTMSFIPGMLDRLLAKKPFPVSFNFLSCGFADVTVERLDERTILVTPEGGYTPMPGSVVDPATGMVTDISVENVYRALEGLTYNPRNPMKVGQIVTLSEVTIEVTRMTEDGRIAQAKFQFAHPLEEDRYVWLLWQSGTSTYLRVAMPPVGEIKVY